MSDLLDKLQSATEGSRFLSKVDVRGPNDCWLWLASKNQFGYGQFSGGKRPGYRMWRAHKWAYVTAIGPVPDGLVLDHLCDVKACVNPAHLKAVTHRENILRGTSPSAISAKKTHCPSEHPYAGDNLYVRPDGSRTCRTCKREELKRYRARKAHEARAEAA